MNQNDTQREQLLKRLSAEDFALYEVALYLDAYPQNAKALAYYAAHKQLAQALREEYESRFGPLTLYGNQDPNAWRWTQTPWPWEKEVN
jgi:spore coat protein JB